MSTCRHPKAVGIASLIRVFSAADSTEVGFVMCLQAHCEVCGARFRFTGLPAADTPSIPSVSADGMAARLPIVSDDIMVTTEPMGMLAGAGRA